MFESETAHLWQGLPVLRTLREESGTASVSTGRKSESREGHTGQWTQVGAGAPRHWACVGEGGLCWGGGLDEWVGVSRTVVIGIQFTGRGGTTFRPLLLTLPSMQLSICCRYKMRYITGFKQEDLSVQVFTLDQSALLDYIISYWRVV